MRIVWILLICVYLIQNLSAQGDFSNPVHIDKSDGLSHHLMYSITKDPYGFMWFGTENGLCRFDGSRIEVVPLDPLDSIVGKKKRVYDLVADSIREVLWIGTEHGLHLLNLKTRSYHPFFQPNTKSDSLLTHGPIKMLMQDRQGELWVALFDQGIGRFDPSQQKFEQYIYHSAKGEETDPHAFKRNMIIHGLHDQKNDSVLWFGTRSGLLRFNKFTKQFRRYEFSKGNRNIAPSINAIRTIYQHNDGIMYLGTWGAGVMMFNPETENFDRFRPTLSNPPLPPGNGIIFGFFPKSETELWISTSHGIVGYHTQKKEILWEKQNDPNLPYRYRIDFLDEKNRNWVRAGNGLYCFDPKNQQIEQFPVLAQAEPGFTPSKVLVHQGRIYMCGSGGQGIYRLNQTEKTWECLMPQKKYLTRRGKFRGVDMIVLDNDQLFILARSQAFIWHPALDSLQSLEWDIGHTEPHFQVAIKDKRGLIWISSARNGLHQFNPRTQELHIFQQELNPSLSQKGIPPLGTITEDSLGQIWMSTHRGYNIYNVEQNKFYHFRSHPNKSQVWTITGLLPTKDKVWISDEIGIWEADLQHSENKLLSPITFALYRGKSLLEFKGLDQDHQGYIWVNSSKALLKINPQNKTFFAFNGHHGLISQKGELDQLRISCLDILSTGEIAIGTHGYHGLSIFDPQKLSLNDEIPIPYLSSLSVLNKPYPLDTALIGMRRLILPYEKNIISFEFSAIGYTHTHQYRFKYMLEGFDEEWIFPESGKNYASYTNLEEGDYRILIMVANGADTWNPVPHTLELQILAPWYRTWWAFSVYFILFASILYSIYRIQLNRQLAAAETYRLRELDQVKTRLYTNITHEFRTPLTIIQGMNEKIAEAPSTWLDKGTDMIRRNSRHLLRLVNQMLDLSKLESGKLSLRLIQGDIIPYLHYLAESFHSFAETQNVELQVLPHPEGLIMDYDPERLKDVMSNLLSNAIKFTPIGGQITISFTERDRHLHIEVQDTGIGISEEKIPHIFERFYQADDSSTRQGEGTGIGLTLSRELVHLMKGRIFVQSTIGNGSTFTVSLPITQEANKDESTVKKEQAVSQYFSTNPIDRTIQGKGSQANPQLPLALIVEDNEDVVNYLITCLEYSYRIEIAQHGQKGIDLALELIPDIIISDVMMPLKDGFEVCDTLKKDIRTSHIPIIMLTARADMDSRIEGLQKGADAYLAKPFSEEELLIRMKKLLELRKRLQQYYLSLSGDLQESTILPQGDQQEDSEPSFVKQVYAYIEGHLTDDSLNVESLCRELGMSHSQLHRKLTALTGYSTNRYIRHIRIEKAKKMLQETQLSISEVAYATGFNDPYYFSRAFKQKEGLSPSEWRNT